MTRTSLTVVLLLTAGALTSGSRHVTGQDKKNPVFQGREATELVEKLKDPSPAVRRDAAAALEAVCGQGRIGPEAAAYVVPALVEALADPEVRRTAFTCLRLIGRPAGAAAPALVKELHGPKPVDRLSATSALGRIGPAAEPAVPRLVQMLNDPGEDRGVRGEVIAALGTLRTDSPDAVAALIRIVNDSSPVFRPEAAEALGRIGPPAKRAVPDLIRTLSDAELTRLRRQAAFALGEMGPDAGAAVPALRAALADPDPNLSWNAAVALGNIGPGASAAVPDLVARLDATPAPGQADLRRKLLTALGRIGPAAGTAVPRITTFLGSPDRALRLAAAEALGQIGPDARPAAPALSARAIDDQEPEVRRAAATALGRVGLPDGSAGGDAVQNLGRVLDDVDLAVRRAAADALARIGPPAGPAVPALVRALSDRELAVRVSAAAALGRVDSGREDAAVDALLAVVRRPDEPAGVRWAAARAVAGIATRVQGRKDTARLPRLREVAAALKDAAPAVGEPPADGPADGGFDEAVLGPVGRAVDALDSMRRADLLALFADRVRDILTSKWVVFPALYAGVVLSWWVLLRLRPLWLLAVNDYLRPLDATLPSWLSGMKVPVRKVLLLEWFNYHPRVLDAWVAAHLAPARQKFAGKPTVEARQNPVPVPVVLDRQALTELRPSDLRTAFARTGVLLVWGEGGSGKTTLACAAARWAMADDPADRLAAHRMLPVLVEQELAPDAGDGAAPLVKAVHGELEALVGSDRPIPEELVRQLMWRRRLLVVVDHFSELSEAARDLLHPGQDGFPARALVVTSRRREDLDHVARAELEPLRVKGDRLSSFLEAYLTREGERHLFTDEEFFEACRGLARMVGNRDVTVLLAVLYARQVIARQARRVDEELSNNVPDLMLQYLSEVNRGVPVAERRKDADVHRDAKALAWLCVRSNFRPGSVRRDIASGALTGADPDGRLDYLERRLRVLQPVFPDKVRFALDPTAEYLAQLYLVEEYGGTEAKWKAVLDALDAQPGRWEGVRGFLQALLDCCRTKGPEYGVPAWLEAKVDARLTGPGPAGSSGGEAAGVNSSERQSAATVAAAASV
ncbi:HEAT repeat domain-containing protein [bacterium]|nr:HEAT repeat domain-containing protein [bacterium]